MLPSALPCDLRYGGSSSPFCIELPTLVTRCFEEDDNVCIPLFRSHIAESAGHSMTITSFAGATDAGGSPPPFPVTPVGFLALGAGWKPRVVWPLLSGPTLR